MENGRIGHVFKDFSERYLIDKEKDYEGPFFLKQFCSFYTARRRWLLPRVLDQAKNVLGPNVQPSVFSELKAKKPALITGVLIKNVAHRPSVFAEFRDKNLFVDEEEEEHELLEVNVGSATGSKDTLWLEDNYQRMQLNGNIDKDEFVPGYVVGLYGAMNERGTKFTVEKLILPTLAPQPPLPAIEDDKYVMFLSGVRIETSMSNNEYCYLAFNQLIDWLHGSGDFEDEDLARRVVRVVFAGDTVHITEDDMDDQHLTKIGYTRSFDETAIEQADRILHDLAEVVDIHVMSGPNDCCPMMWPQEPMLPSVFHNTSKEHGKRFHTAPNPWGFAVDELHFLGTSGQNLSDLRRFTRNQPAERLMKQMLECSHVCPTCPNTIDGFPFELRDPLVLEEMPHVFFAGNQEAHWSQRVALENGAEVTCFAIPKFHQTFQAVLFNVRTQETRVIFFGQELLDEDAL